MLRNAFVSLHLIPLDSAHSLGSEMIETPRRSSPQNALQFVASFTFLGYHFYLRRRLLWLVGGKKSINYSVGGLALWFMIFDKCLSTQPQSVEICRRIPIPNPSAKENLHAKALTLCHSIIAWNEIWNPKFPTPGTPSPFRYPITIRMDRFTFRHVHVCLTLPLVRPLLCSKNPLLHANIDWVAHALASCFFFYSIIVIWQRGLCPRSSDSGFWSARQSIFGFGLVGEWEWQVGSRDWVWKCGMVLLWEASSGQ